LKATLLPAICNRPGISAKRIRDLAQQGDEVALRAVEQEAYSLGLGLANLINLFTLDAVVLSGSGDERRAFISRVASAP
jgi:predicted NBD/HSP70 family sugar kinase